MTLVTAVELHGAEKAYPGGGFHLGPVDLQIALGRTVAVLGKNGSGKSTLFHLLTGNHDATAGTILIGGEKMHRGAYDLKRRLGYLPQHMDLPRWVTGFEILSYAARLYELADPKACIATAMDIWDFASYAYKPMAACSYGMQKRVGLALATFHDPQVLILDEPFSGLDLFHIKALEDTITTRRDGGRVTIVSTHVASYAARHCHQAYIIRAGRLVAVHGWDQLGFSERIAALEELFFGAGKEV